MENADRCGQFTFEDLRVGTRFQRQYVISADVYQRFLDLFGDASPLHVDDQVAMSSGFPAKLMHGAILNGFISNFVGMNFPGRRSLELGVEIRYRKPAYLDDVLELEAVVKQRLESRRVVLLEFVFRRQDTPIASGTVTVLICDL